LICVAAIYVSEIWDMISCHTVSKTAAAVPQRRYESNGMRALHIHIRGLELNKRVFFPVPTDSGLNPKADPMYTCVSGTILGSEEWRDREPGT
jgi:hypothetical protein